jgi:molybdate transport system substrate-binding protein
MARRADAPGLTHLRAIAIGATLLAAGALPVEAGKVRAAVAANFTRVAEQIGADFSAATGHEVVLSFGATGTLYMQISQGAPFDVFLAADDRRPAQAIVEGLAVAGSAFTYARGALVLYAPEIDLADGAAVLAGGTFQHIAVADPLSAPYGAAAMAYLERTRLAPALLPDIVMGETITQTLQFIESGNAELGFVALSQVLDRPQGSVWRVPPEDYPPIRQDAVLLTAGEANTAARDFLDYLRSAPARAVIEAAGYTLE